MRLGRRLTSGIAADPPPATREGAPVTAEVTVPGPRPGPERDTVVARSSTVPATAPH